MVSTVPNLSKLVKECSAHFEKYLNFQEIFERAELGPAALLEFLKWEGREKTKWTMTILVGELKEALHPDAEERQNHDSYHNCFHNLSH